MLRRFSSQAGGLVKVTVDGKIATVTLNQPDKLNALTVKMGDEFQGVFVCVSLSIAQQAQCCP
jgi:enoyl-CoA hydratase/carnithine racemase